MRMRRIGWSIVLAAAAATPARADVETIEGQQRELGLGPRDAVGRSGLRWSAFAQLVGEGEAALALRERRAEGTAAVGAELRVVRERCEPVRLGGQARLAWSGAARPSAEQWASGCLDADFLMAELGHHLEWDVRPSLLAPIQLRAGLNRRETMSVNVQMLRMPLSLLDGPEPRLVPRTDAFVLFDVELHASWMWSEDTPPAAHQEVEAIGIRYERPAIAPWGERRDYGVDVVAGGGEFTDAGSSVAAWVVRISNYQSGPVFVTGGIGFSSAGIGPLVTRGDITEHQIDLTTPRALVALETGGSRLHGYVRGTNDIGLGADGYILRDSRLAGGLALEAPGTRLGLDGFVGKTKLYALDVAPVRGTTGGAALSLARGLGAHLEATLQLEVARSFYALAPEAMAGALGPPRWGVNAMAALQATAGR